MTHQIDKQATHFNGARPRNAVLGNSVPAAPLLDHSSVFNAEVVQTNAVHPEPSGPVKNSLVGRQLDDYMVEKWLGGGGMGQVYLARHRWLDVPVAIKVMNSGDCDDPEAVDRFRREARMAAALDHPNIVKATDGGSFGNSLYIVTEYIEGLDLKELVQQSGPLQANHACWLIMEVAKGLQHAHERGLIHRDIKPANIMLLKNGSIKVLDLGLARFNDGQTQLTSTGQFMGTVDYVSPEQAVDTRNVDHRADIYSLGCTFYCLLTGRAPFEGEAYDTVISKILAHADEAPLDVDCLVRGVPKGVIRILEQMIAKHPDDRFGTCAEIAEALSKFAGPLNGDRRANVASPAMPSTSVKNRIRSQGSNILVGFASGLLDLAWLFCRTILSITGILKRVEITNNSRLGGKPRYNWQVSMTGVVTFTMITFLFCSIFLGGFNVFNVINFILNMTLGPPTEGSAPVEISF